MLSRRTLLQTSALAAAQAQSSSKPNIVLILSDDHTAEFTGSYGNPTVRTPNLDRFASEGMRFTKFFCSAPQCVPSRTAYMTGRSPVSARMSRFTSPLPPDIVTLPELLRKDAGYFTGICRRQFHLDGAPGPNSKAIYDKHKLQTFQNRVDYLDRASPREMTGKRVNEFFDKRPKEKPYFLWVNFDDPHYSWDNIPGGVDAKTLRVPKWLPDLPGVREDLRRYYDEIGRMDGEFQLVLDTIQKRAGMDNTLILFAGDNGIPFPHGKGSLYDPGLNVPFLMRWTGKIKPGVSNDLISGEDVTPTLLAAAGVSPAPGMSGQSFLPHLLGQSYTARRNVFAQRVTHGSRPFAEGTTTHTFDHSRMARNARYKLIYNCTPGMRYSPVDSYNERSWVEMSDENAWGRLAPRYSQAYFGKRAVFELFDLEKDPEEFVNLAGRPEVEAVEKELKLALHEKMILDWDYLPLPLTP
ncbi:MAG: sulfatase [Bryobacteraceae bacterium]|nr:sulfatase [Bryobacteraceae bacterium]